MVTIKCSILLILWIAGSNGIELLLSRSSSLCSYDTQTWDLRCDHWPLLEEDNVDIHMSKGYVFYISFDENNVKRMKYPPEEKRGRAKEETVKSDKKMGFMGVTVDWYNDQLYLNYKYSELFRTDLFGRHSRIILRLADVAKTIPTVKYDLRLLHVRLDPYAEFLFSQACFLDVDGGFNRISCFIARTDLNGKNLTISQSLIFPYTIYFAIDIHNKTLHIVGENNFNQFITYDYEGNQMGSYNSSFESGKFDVFEGAVYMVNRNSSEEIYRQPTTNEKETDPNTWGTMYRPDIGVLEDVRVLDVRAQRRRFNGTYLCDRSDCSDLCRVTVPDGDECYCFSGRRVGPDDKTCDGCGQSSMSSSTLIPLMANGIVSKIGQFPWHAVIFHLSKDGSWKAECGGTLLSPRAVLTAAHCVTSECDWCTPQPMMRDQIKVALGKITREWSNLEAHEIRINVAEIRPHFYYKGFSTKFAYDIALLISDVEIVYNDFVMPACVDYNYLHYKQLFLTPGLVAGMGRTTECVARRRECGPPSSELQHKTVRIISFLDCYDRAQNLTRSTSFTLAYDRFCVDGNGSGSVIQKGDSGGGLTFNFGGLYYVYGIVSTKLVPPKVEGKEHVFGSFTDLSKHFQWLKEQLTNIYK